MSMPEHLQLCLFDPGHPHKCEHSTMRVLIAEHVDGSGPLTLPAGTRVMVIGFAFDLEDSEKGCMVAKINEAIIFLPERTTCPTFLLHLR